MRRWAGSPSAGPKKYDATCRFRGPSFDVMIEPGLTPAPNPNPEGDKTMRFMVMVKANKHSEAGVLPDEKLLTEMGKYNEELVKAGVLLAAEGLQPSSKGARVGFSGGKRTVIDGPFAEAKEEAIEWVRRCPNPFPGAESEIEIRQVFEASDFGPEFTPELREQEERMRAQAEKRMKAGKP